VTSVHLSSPLFSTLTEAISDDSSVAAPAQHLYMHDCCFFKVSVAQKLSEFCLDLIGPTRACFPCAGRPLGGTLWRALRQCALLLTGVRLLSPLYSTLTEAISDDTIVAASAWLMLLHLYMHDYFFKVSVAQKLSGSLSMAAAVAASLLLASRLSRPDKVVLSSH
jgi:hypothetical protein